MGKGYLIDSNIIIGYLDDKLPSKALEIMNPIIDDIPNVSVITKIEILRFKTSDTKYQVLKNFIDETVVFGLNDQVVERTIEICKTNKIKLPDAIIAATALVYNMCLITRNVSDFKSIIDLNILNPWD